MQVRHGVLVAALLVLAAPAAHSGGERDKAPADLAREGVQAYAQEDYGRARHLLRRAAEAGAPRAQYYLGRMYSWGHGVQRDETIASRWILKAARGGFRHAQEVIAARYMDGTGLPRDHVAAYRWLSVAAANGSMDAHQLRDQWLVKHMTPAELEEARHQPLRPGGKPVSPPP